MRSTRHMSVLPGHGQYFQDEELGYLTSPVAPLPPSPFPRKGKGNRINMYSVPDTILGSFYTLFNLILPTALISRKGIVATNTIDEETESQKT